MAAANVILITDTEAKVFFINNDAPDTSTATTITINALGYPVTSNGNDGNKYVIVTGSPPSGRVDATIS